MRSGGVLESNQPLEPIVSNHVYLSRFSTEDEDGFRCPLTYGFRVSFTRLKGHKNLNNTEHAKRKECTESGILR